MNWYQPQSHHPCASSVGWTPSIHQYVHFVSAERLSYDKICGPLQEISYLGMLHQFHIVRIALDKLDIGPAANKELIALCKLNKRFFYIKSHQGVFRISAVMNANFMLSFCQNGG